MSQIFKLLETRLKLVVDEKVIKVMILESHSSPSHGTALAKVTGNCNQPKGHPCPWKKTREVSGFVMSLQVRECKVEGFD